MKHNKNILIGLVIPVSISYICSSSVKTCKWKTLTNNNDNNFTLNSSIKIVILGEYFKF